MNCPSCQRSLPDEFKFCPHCGVQIASNCPSCGKQADPAWVSCPYCGAALKGRASQPAPVNPPQPPPQQYPQTPYQHGYHHGSSSRKKKKRGFLGGIFSSWREHPWIEGYAIDAFLGQGSYGVVIKASRGKRYYAIKALIDREDHTPSMLPFKLESEILRRISHPQIPGFVEAFSTGDIHYIVQEFIEGLPLSCLLGTGRRFSEDEVKRIVSQLLSILGDLHCPPQRENAVVHRDLRLSNLLLKEDKLFLVDFGFARFLDLPQNFSCPDPLENKYSGSSGDGLTLKQLNDLPSRKKIPGAETYRLLRTEISPRSDLFGAGVVAVDLFTNWVEDETLYNRPWQEVLPLSQPFVDFLQKLLAREDGFETAAKALEHLRSLS